MSGTERRELLIKRLSESRSPIPGKALADLTGVSRQVIVQDIAILRTGGFPITATRHGYVLQSMQSMQSESDSSFNIAPNIALDGESFNERPFNERPFNDRPFNERPSNGRPSRLFKVCHSVEETEQELFSIVDLGGLVLDVMVNHRAYGQITVDLGFKSRRDVRLFIEDLKSGKSYPLMLVTSGYHFHRVFADTEEILDEIEEALSKMGFLVEFSEYEAKNLV